VPAVLAIPVARRNRAVRNEALRKAAPRFPDDKLNFLRFCGKDGKHYLNSERNTVPPQAGLACSYTAYPDGQMLPAISLRKTQECRMAALPSGLVLEPFKRDRRTTNSPCSMDKATLLPKRKPRIAAASISVNTSSNVNDCRLLCK